MKQQQIHFTTYRVHNIAQKEVITRFAIGPHGDRRHEHRQPEQRYRMRKRIEYPDPKYFDIEELRIL